MRIVVDQKIPFVEEAFSPFGEIVKYDSRAIDGTAVRDADALLVRSETRVNDKLLAGSSVKFVGTATIGTDHIDIDFLRRNDIAFASAPGCNSNAVVQYVFSALFTLAKRNNFMLKGKTLGVVGVGNIGSKIVRVAEKLGMEVLQNDPPLSRATRESRFLSLDDLMAANFITIHVPYTKTGSDPTFHLFDEARISAMKKGSTLINTSRGGVVDNKAMKEALRNGTIGDGILDVWENEPNIDTELLSICSIGTPHIAGYSINGKVNATKMIYSEFCDYFNFPKAWDPSSAVPIPEKPEISVDKDTSDEESTVSEVVTRVYNIENDDSTLRKISSMPQEQMGAYFKGLRGNYHFRDEFSNFTIALQSKKKYLIGILGTFGFKVLHPV
ncbi:MAG: 4-phosphoerythronate dehydrogenase PdxB [Bacteroidetes bacterium]|nr:4-phosphoerythronate dehydrogenase PdxB [Bacteroidota bacterium]